MNYHLYIHILFLNFYLYLNVFNRLFLISFNIFSIGPSNSLVADFFVVLLLSFFEVLFKLVEVVSLLLLLLAFFTLFLSIILHNSFNNFGCSINSLYFNELNISLNNNNNNNKKKKKKKKKN